MYVDDRVARFVSDNFLPVRVHVKDDADEFQRLGGRFGAEWTPTILIVDPQGEERHRVEGFLPSEELLGQLEFGLARVDFSAGSYGEAEARFREIVEGRPDTEAAPQALYWAGVARYKATNDGGALEDTARAFQGRYQETPWAKKASVWSDGGA